MERWEESNGELAEDEGEPVGLRKSTEESHVESARIPQYNPRRFAGGSFRRQLKGRRFVRLAPAEARQISQRLTQAAGHRDLKICRDSRRRTRRMAMNRMR